MVDLAYAMGAGGTGGGAGGGGLGAFLPLIIIFVIFYFLLIRPQQKKGEAAPAASWRPEKGGQGNQLGRASWCNNRPDR